MDAASVGAKRKLAAILSADVKGFSRLMEADEEGTLRAFTSYRQEIDRLISRHDGRIVGAAGDSVLAEFASPVQAARCAIEVQDQLARKNADFSHDRRHRSISTNFATRPSGKGSRSSYQQSSASPA